MWIDINGLDDIFISTFNLYIDGELTSSTSSDSLTYQWNTRKAADGIHTIKAEVVDSGGNIVVTSIQLNHSSNGNGNGRKNR